MLILSRKTSQALVIDGDIRITVLKTHGDTVRLGIEAPLHVTVHRDEVHERILAESGRHAESDLANGRKGAA